jgi:hypothetical protein
MSSFEGFVRPRKDAGGTNTGDANATANDIFPNKTAYVQGVKVTGTGTSDATAVAGDILLGKTAYAQGVKLTGTFQINALLANYTIASGQTINAGDLVKFINNQASKPIYGFVGNSIFNWQQSAVYLMSATALDSGRVLIVYFEQNGNNLRGVVLSISGTTITAGTPVNIRASVSVNGLSVAVLSSSMALVCFTNTAREGEAWLTSISGTSISTLSYAYINGLSQMSSISAVALDSTKAVVAFMDESNNYYGTAVALSVSGSTVTVGTPFVFRSASVQYISATKLDNTKVLLAYQDGGNFSYGTAIVLSVSGTTITAGTAVVFRSGTNLYNSATTLDSSKVLVAYGGNSGFATAVILSVSGTTITVGTAVVFESASPSSISTTTLDNTKVLVVYNKDINDPSKHYGKNSVLVISGTTITVQGSIIFRYANVFSLRTTVLDSGKALSIWSDSGLNNYPTANVLTPGYDSVQGVALQSGTAGQSKQFYDWRLPQ